MGASWAEESLDKFDDQLDSIGEAIKIELCQNYKWYLHEFVNFEETYSLLCPTSEHKDQCVFYVVLSPTVHAFFRQTYNLAWLEGRDNLSFLQVVIIVSGFALQLNDQDFVVVLMFSGFVTCVRVISYLPNMVALDWV